MGNAKKGYKDIKEEEESRQLLKKEEKSKVESKVLKEQLNTRFISFYKNKNKNKSRRDDGGQSAIAPIDSLRSGKAPTFAAVENNRCSQRASSAVLQDFKAEFERAKRAVEDEIAVLCLSNSESSFLRKKDFRVKLERAHLEKESSVAMWRDRHLSITTENFCEQFGRGDVMLGLRRVPFIYVEARCSQIDELPVTTDVRVQFSTTQFDQERSITLWRELVRESSAINNILDRISVTANGRAVSEGAERDVKFRIAMWGESYPDFNSAWERLKNATLVSTSSNSEKNIVEVAVHQGVSISIEGFLFEANTNLPLNNNSTMFKNNGSQSISSDSLEWFRLYMENYKQTYNNDSIHNFLRRLSLNAQNTLDVTQVAEVAQDCSAQRTVEPIAVLSMSVTPHNTNSYQLQEYFK